MSDRPTVRLLAVDPIPRGFGFVVLEDGKSLVDWGVREVREDKTAGTLAKVGELIDLYRPGILVTEECSDRSSRRAPRIARLIEDIITLGAERGLVIHTVSPWRVYATFAAEGADNKERINAALCQRFPELLLQRPPLRKPWMSEDDRQAIFDAAGFAVVAFASV